MASLREKNSMFNPSDIQANSVFDVQYVMSISYNLLNNTPRGDSPTSILVSTDKIKPDGQMVLTWSR